MVAAEVERPLPRPLPKAVPGPPVAEVVQWSVFVFVRSRLCLRALPRSLGRGLVRLILCLMCFARVLWILVSRFRVLLDLGRIRLRLVRPAQCFACLWLVRCRCCGAPFGCPSFAFGARVGAVFLDFFAGVVGLAVLVA